MSKIKKECLWPEKKLPKEYDSTIKKYPCPKCKRFLLDNMGQSVIVKSRDNVNIYFRCKGCGHNFSLPRVSYVFEDLKLCSICGCKTIAYSTRGRQQYRKCVNETCNWRGVVNGKKVKT